MPTYDLTNSHLLMRHDGVNGGVVVGFLLQDPGGGAGEEENMAIQIFREEDKSQRGVFDVRKAFYGTLYLKTGASYGGLVRDAAVDRKNLYDFLKVGKDLELITAAGAYGALEWEGHTATETQFLTYSLAQIRLKSLSDQVQPADATRWLASKWVTGNVLGSFDVVATVPGLAVEMMLKPGGVQIYAALMQLNGGADTAKAHVGFNGPVNLTAWTLQFHLTVDRLAMAAADLFHVAWASGLVGFGNHIQLRLDDSSGTRRIRLTVFNDAGVALSTAFYAIGKVDEILKVAWKAATGPGLNNGEARLYVGGILKETIAAIDNDLQRVDDFQVGGVSAIDVGTVGNLWISEIQWGSSYDGLDANHVWVLQDSPGWNGAGPGYWR